MGANLQVVEGGQEHITSVAVTPSEALEAYKVLQEITNKVLREDIDYGVIPGTPKPTLLKPGAENLLRFYGLGHRIQATDKVTDWDQGFFYFAYKVTVHKTLPNGTEVVVSECEGSANSKESRYADRWVPQWKLREYGISNTKGLQSRDRENRHGEYKEYKIKNRDPYTLVNTLQKMAIKRALVGATLQATGASGIFTQDIEDMGDFIQTDAVSDKEQDQRYENTKSKKTQQTKNPYNSRKATDRQVAAIVKIAESKKYTEDDIKAVVKGQYNKSIDELDKSEASDMIRLLNEIKDEELKSLVEAHNQPEETAESEYVDRNGKAIDISDDELPF